MKIQNIPVTSIKPYWRNPRKNESAVEAVKQSIQDYGFNVPLVLDRENVIIAGHTRYKAMLALGAKEIPCVIADLSPEKAREYRIADNKTGELSSWDVEALTPELRDIADISHFQAYFPEEDLTALLGDMKHYDFSAMEASEESIQKQESATDRMFAEKRAQVDADLVRVVCPECGKEFSLSLKELAAEKKLSDEAADDNG